MDGTGKDQMHVEEGNWFQTEKKSFCHSKRWVVWAYVSMQQTDDGQLLITADCWCLTDYFYVSMNCLFYNIYVIKFTNMCFWCFNNLEWIVWWCLFCFLWYLLQKSLKSESFLKAFPLYTCSSLFIRCLWLQLLLCPCGLMIFGILLIFVVS